MKSIQVVLSLIGMVGLAVLWTVWPEDSRGFDGGENRLDPDSGSSTLARRRVSDRVNLAEKKREALAESFRDSLHDPGLACALLPEILEGHAFTDRSLYRDFRISMVSFTSEQIAYVLNLRANRDD